MKKFALIVLQIAVFNCLLFSQEYSYQDFRNDHFVLFKAERLLREYKIDSVKMILPSYKNRLGFKYYQYKALVANFDSDSLQYKYLDSAFMRGMTPLCIDKYLYKFDSTRVNTSFKQNYLKAYDLRLINVIDSIHYKDQEYRQQLVIEVKKKEQKSTKQTSKPLDESDFINLNVQMKDQRIDSLKKLVHSTDSTNLIKLKEIINEYGWPGAKLVGEYYCQRPAPDVTMFFIHLGNTQREYQIANLKEVIELCKKQEEDWDNAQSLLFGIHTKFSREFSEFSFLFFENNHLDTVESYFSVYKMTEILMQSSTKKIEIKCANEIVYNELKQFMIRTCKIIPINKKQNSIMEELGYPIAKVLDESSFLFIESPELAPNSIQYKMTLK